MQLQANYVVPQDYLDYMAGTNPSTPDVNTLARAESYVDLIAAGRPMVIPATDTLHEVQVTGGPTGGTFTLSWTIAGTVYTTGPIAYNSTSDQLRTALSAVSRFPGTFVVIGGPLPVAPLFIGYRGGLGAQLVNVGTATPSLTGGAASAVNFTVSAPGGGVNKRFNLAGLQLGQIVAIKNAVAAQVEYMGLMEPKLFAQPQYDSIKGPDFTTTGKLSVISPKARREMTLAGLTYSTARSRP